MRVNIERIPIILIVLLFAVTLMNMLVMQGSSLTREEAIEISRNSRVVGDLLKDAEYYTLIVRYMNSTQVNKAREEFPSLNESYPENRSIWLVTWYIRPKDAVSSFSYIVSHVIEEDMGQIIYEGLASER